jgi:hypothetical protein
VTIAGMTIRSIATEDMVVSLISPLCTQFLGAVAATIKLQFRIPNSLL